jgi:hypothetical protein
VTIKASIVKKIDLAILSLKSVQSNLPFYMKSSEHETCEYRKIDETINDLKECLVLLEKTEI